MKSAFSVPRVNSPRMAPLSGLLGFAVRKGVPVALAGFGLQMG